MEKDCWKKINHLEEKVNNLEGDVVIRRYTNLHIRTSKGKVNNYTFSNT